MTLDNIFTSSKTQKLFRFEKRSINKAMSISLFCNKHDTKVFKPIETNQINIDDYTSQLLFSYRSMCAEIRRKQVAIEYNNRVLSDRKCMKFINSDMYGFISAHISGLKIGINDLRFYKSEFEKYLTDKVDKDFIFNIFEYNFLPVCTAATFSPINENDINNNPFQEKPLNTVFINLIPINKKLMVIIGYHKDFVNKWILDFIDSWNTKDNTTQQVNVSELIANRVESWAMSMKFFNSIDKEKKDKMLEHWESNMMSHDEDLYFGVNLFS